MAHTPNHITFWTVAVATHWDAMSTQRHYLFESTARNQIEAFVKHQLADDKRLAHLVDKFSFTDMEPFSIADDQVVEAWRYDLSNLDRAVHPHAGVRVTLLKQQMSVTTSIITQPISTMVVGP